MNSYQISEPVSEYLPYTYYIEWSAEQTCLGYSVRYYGSKYGKDAHPDLFWVTYFTSSELVVEKRQAWGEPSIIKVRKKFHGLSYGKATTKIVTDYEHRVLKFVDARNNPRYLNLSNGAADWGVCIAGMVTVTNIETGWSGIITQEDFYANRHLYRYHSDGMVSVPGIGQITQEEFHTNRHLYQHKSDGMVNIPGHQVPQEEFHTNRHLYQHAADGMVNVIGGQVTREEFLTNRHLYQHPTDGTVNVPGIGKIPQEEFHTNRHRYQLTTDGTVRVTVKTTGERVRITSDEYHTNRHLYSHPADGMVNVKGGQVTKEEFDTNRHLYQVALENMVTVIVKATGKSTNVPSEEYHANKHLFQHPIQGNKAATIVSTGKRIRARDDDPRYETGEIRQGWK